MTVLFEHCVRDYSSGKYRKYPDRLNDVAYVVPIRIFIARSQHTVLSRTTSSDLEFEVPHEKEFKRMSDVTNRYVVRAKCVAEEQYTSFRSALSKTM